MSVKNTLTNIVLVGSLALGGMSCGSTEKGYSNLPQQYPTEIVSGKIVSIEKDNFPIFTRSGPAAGGASFQYEHIRVRNHKGNIKQLLSPYPTGYKVGDELEFTYRIRTSVTFSELSVTYPELFKEYRHFGNCTLQYGVIRMDRGDNQSLKQTNSTRRSWYSGVFEIICL